MSIFKKLRKYVMSKSRSKKIDHFYSLCDSQSTILDVGVSNNEYNDSINLFLRRFRFHDSQYTGLAVQSMEKIKKKYPGKNIIEYSGRIFPFNDDEFNWVFSNAVIEHVGSKSDQLLFLNEMLRVGKNIFFTTPNKWFPVESHTNVFFRHWFDDSFYKWCKLNKSCWSVDNLLLLGINDIKDLLEKSSALKYEITVNTTLGWPMTYTIVCSTESS